MARCLFFPSQKNNLTPNAMRTLLITLLSLTLGLNANARFRANSQLNIRMADLSSYTVVFNNTTYFATEWVKIYNVPPGKHYLRIEESVQTYGRGMQATGHRLIYAGWVTVPPASIVNSRVNYNRSYMVARIDRLDCGRPNGGGYNHHGPYDNRYPQQGGYGNNYPDQYPTNRDDYDEDENDDQDDYGNQGGQDQDGTYDDGTYGNSKLVAKPINPSTVKPVVNTNSPKKSK